MTDKKKIYKPRPISGFPEWLPEVRRIEQQWFDHIQKIFDSYGFCYIEKLRVEELNVINIKGDNGSDVDKEVYVLERLHKEEGSKEARLALHFDQTVPLARYVAQHFNDLIFPFKRYQIQRVWRGERPQAGRFREFYQCDIDVINIDSLPLHFDAEMPAIIWEILSSLPGMENEKLQIRISNRKILMGYCLGLGISKIPEVMRIMDKLEKIGNDETYYALGKLDLTPGQAKMLIDMASLKTSDPSKIQDFIYKIEGIDGHGYVFDGLRDLKFVLEQLSHLPEGAVVADLSIVRGLDYYTGTVYETVFTEDPGYGSICSGGRYNDLTSNYINKRLPGVGISIGFSRLFDRIRREDKLPVKGSSPADILVVMPSEEQRSVANETGLILRRRGFNVEVFHGGKLKRQLAYAEKKGIPYVWFPPFENGNPHEVKNMETGKQIPTTTNDWNKDE